MQPSDNHPPFPVIRGQHYTGERALYARRGATIEDTVFSDGESPLKESADLTLRNCLFEWRYPLWYGKGIRMEDCAIYEGARAAIWYTDDISLRHTTVSAPKCIRRCRGVTLEHVQFSDAAETLWHCRDVRMTDVTAKGEYFAMNSEHLEIDGLTLFGKYSFDGVKNVTIRRSRLMTKDAFWNSENVTVYDSFISSEYLGWNAKNLTFINCTVESLQGMCYIDNLVMKNCKLLNTTLAFEYSTVDAEIQGSIDSVLNPSGGTIRADHIGTLTLEKDRIDPEKVKIICRDDTASE